MKTKLVQLVWRGEASVDPRFSSFMLPWTLADIRNYDNFSRLSVGIEHGTFEAYNVDFELQFSHQLKHIVGMCRVIQKPKSKNRNFEFIIPKSSRQAEANSNQIAEIYGPENGMVYLLKNPRDPLLHIHLYECDSVDEMTELMHQMRDTHHKTIGGSVGNIPQCIVASPRSGDTNFHRTLRNNGVHSTPASNLKFSEALRSAPHDTTPTMSRMSSSKSYTSGLNQSSASTAPAASSSSNAAGGGGVAHSVSSSNLSLLNDISPNNSQFFEVMYVGKIKVSHKRVPHTFIDDALPKFKAYDAQKMKIQSELQRKVSLTSQEPPQQETPENISTSQRITDDLRAKTQSIHEADETRDEEVSAERPAVMRSQSHYAMPVANEPPKQRDRAASIGSISVVEQNRTMVFLIGRSDLRLISPDRKQVLLYKDFKDVASCAHGEKNADHFGIICREMQNDGYIGYVFKCQSENVANDIIAAISQAFINCSEAKQKEKSQVLSCDHCPMIWYHKLCQDIDGLSDKKIQAAIYRRMETLPEDEQSSIMAKYNGADDMAGHSITEQNQFLMMLLRAHCEARQQRHVHDTSENRTEFINQYLSGGTFFLKAKRSLTNSFDHLLKRKGSHAEGLPPVGDLTAERRLDIEKANKRMSGDFGGNGNHETPQLKSPMIDIFMKVGNNPRDHTSHTGSWRQAMLHRVVTPSKGFKEEDEYMSPMRYASQESRKRTKDELRKLWRESAKQIIMLSRMEKENARLQERQNEHELKRVKLEYDDICVCNKHAAETWDAYLENQSRMTQKSDTKILLQAIKNGVPKMRRGEVWVFLAEQHNRHTPPIDTSNFPNYNTPYEVLLKSLTEHQHAIFIDLGRTFPNHQFYKAALGVGQLSLFNLLKAYSILDPELGYCQGLGFLCGILLLHCEEADAFNLLKHLMFKRQMRLKYLPDMKQFQLHLYQLSRLLKDTSPELYEWLDKNDVSPTLYAAPWILTIFSSQFPLGFVARVFDLLFLESNEVIFRIAVALLTIHRDEILKRENFEEIMNYLKNVVPQIDIGTLDRVLQAAYAMDISQKLTEYQVEYNVLQEEITSQNHHMENLNRLKVTNQHLETQLDIAQTSLMQLEQTRQSQQNQIQSMHTQIQGLEVSVHALGRFLSDVCESNPAFDLPGDVRRIVQQVLLAEQQQMQQQQQRRRPIFLDRKIGKSVSVNSHLGLALKVLAEEDADGAGSPKSIGQSKNTNNKKSMSAAAPFFESTFEQIRQQKQEFRLGQIGMRQQPQQQQPGDQQRTPNNDTDSGIATPLSPSNISSASSSNSNKSETSESEPESLHSEQHPLSNCGDINVRFNGTTQLKSLRGTSTVGSARVVKS